MLKGKTINPTVIDLFCGCGGFSLGFEQCGFRVVAAIDSDPHAISTYKLNRPKMTEEAILLADLTQFSPEDLSKKIGLNHVDVILGGPPCQGFSSVRQVDGSNSGKRLIPDSRRDLYKEYLRYIDFFQPIFFAMENVLGMRTMNGGKWWTTIRDDARKIGYRICPTEFLATDFGVPQNRRRLLIVGTRENAGILFNQNHLVPSHRGKEVTLWEAIGDLPPLKAGKGKSPADYDPDIRKKHINNYLKNVIEIDKSEHLYNHIARPHSARDLRDFARLKEGENSHQAMQRGISFEFPYNKDIFKDRYTRLHRKRPCKTILAHLAKDGLMFIHPTQQRSLTVREAARIQSFPDWFKFPDARTHAFRLIGNAVPPLVGKTVGKTFKYLMKQGEKKNSVKSALLPRNIDQAQETLLAAVKKNNYSELSTKDFLCVWNSCFYLMPGLHPDEALDHGAETSDCEKAIDDLILRKYYIRSGWPVALEPLGREAWRRYQTKQITEEDFYPEDAQKAGLLSSFEGESSR
jgi:DNA (cytosine-5)-methyltransferase 1